MLLYGAVEVTGKRVFSLTHMGFPIKNAVSQITVTQEYSQMWWDMPVLRALWEAEAEKSQVPV